MSRIVLSVLCLTFITACGGSSSAPEEIVNPKPEGQVCQFKALNSTDIKEIYSELKRIKKQKVLSFNHLKCSESDKVQAGALVAQAFEKVMRQEATLSLNFAHLTASFFDAQKCKIKDLTQISIAKIQNCDFK